MSEWDDVAIDSNTRLEREIKKLRTRLAAAEEQVEALRADWQVYLDTPHDVLRALRLNLAAARREIEQVKGQMAARDRGNKRLSEEIAAHVKAAELLSQAHQDAALERDAARRALEELRAAAQETLEEIEYWHADYIDALYDKENGWRRVYNKLRAARLAPERPREERG